MRVLAFAALGAVLAGFWAAAALYLWQSRVPGDLRLPDVPLRDYFTAGELERTSDYQRFARANFLLSQAALIAVLVVYALRGPRLLGESAAGRIGTGMLLGMLGLAFVWLVHVPFGLVQLWWERRHGVSREDYLTWLVTDWLSLGGAFLFVSLALLIVMALAGVLRERWWIAGAPAFVALALLFAFLLPYLIPGLERVRDPAVEADAQRLASALQLPPVRVRVEEVRQFTTQPNALAAGLGPTRHVILWDTLLDGRFQDGEIRVVLAHELAHHALDHLWEGIAWYALFAFPGAFLIAVATRRLGGMYEPRAVPFSLLVLVVLQLLASPLQNVVTRHLEAEADWVALETTRDPRSSRALFERFATASLEQPRPPAWAYLLLETHPTIAERIAMVEAWERREGR